MSEIKVGPQPLELISTHNGRQCVLVYTSAATVRRSNLVLFLKNLKREQGGFPPCSALVLVSSQSLQRAHQILKLIHNHSNLERGLPFGFNS